MRQYDRVKAVLEAADKPVTLHQIGSEIWKSFRQRDAETAISARIRDIRHDIKREGKTIHSERVAPRKAHHKYWIQSLPKDAHPQ